MPKPMKRCFLNALSMILMFGATAEPSTAHSEQKFTAQRKPRVTVMTFNDTNTMASNQRYGPSVSAMLVTFLKSKSQFVVVERQDVQSVLNEWERNQEGQTKSELSEREVELLERIDVIIQGNVTVLGDRIEIDAKLLSRVDGRIITAAQRNGPVHCLRPIVDRLGIALEHNFLRPFFGKIQLTLYDPENAQFLLTPILTTSALDEEKPPVELNATIVPGENRDVVRRWINNPTTYEIKNILAGWYSLRLKRPGYTDLRTENAHLRAIEGSKGFGIYHHVTKDLNLVKDDDRAAKFLVRVDSLEVNEIDLTARGLKMRKQQGGIEFTVVDGDGKLLPGAKILMKSTALNINPEYQEALEEEIAASEQAEVEPTAESGPSPTDTGGDDDESKEGDEKRELSRALNKALELVDKSLAPAKEEPEEKAQMCDYFDEESPNVFDDGKQIIYTGETFNIDHFSGGDLYFEGYLGEKVPIGIYEIAAWAPRHQVKNATIVISEDRGGIKSRQVKLERRREGVDILGRSDNRVEFKGLETGLQKSYSLDTERGVKSIHLPVDRYQVVSDIDGFSSWRYDLNLIAKSEDPPSLEEAFSGDGEGLSFSTKSAELRIKNTVWVGGRFKGFQPHPHTYYNPRISEILDDILNESAFDWSYVDADDDKIAALADQLEDVDLLILNEDDMSRIRVYPELASLVRSFIADGRSVMAFVTREGDYQNVLGRPLSLKRRYSTSDRMRLGYKSGSDSDFNYDVDLGQGRRLPKIKEKKQLSGGAWNVISYTKKRKKPRVIEYGAIDEGGYVMVWFETSRAWASWQSFLNGGSNFFQRLFGGGRDKVPINDSPQDPRVADSESEQKDSEEVIERQIKIAEARLKARNANSEVFLIKSQLQSRMLLWAEYLMYRRLDGEDKRMAEVRDRILATRGSQ